VQGKFSIDYAPGMKRRETRSTVYLPADSGRWRTVEVGDEHPLTFAGYNLYTSFNKGFAPILTFVDGRGISHSGSIHLPSYPLNYYKQGNTWSAPGADRPVKIWLHIAEPVYAEDRAWRFEKPDAPVLVVMTDGVRRELRPGEDMPLGAGTLRFEEVRSWMGYTISYNPALPWILASAAIAVLFLAWHIAGRLFSRPWQAEGEAEARAEGHAGEVQHAG